jgi:transcriptional regulator with XRE-family HTH domain
MESKNERLAKFVRELRGSQSQRQFAKQIGVSQACVGYWEGCVALPDPENLKRLANLKGWSLDDLQTYLYTGELPKNDPLEQIAIKIRSLSLHDVAYLNSVCASTMAERLQAS